MAQVMMSALGHKRTSSGYPRNPNSDLYPMQLLAALMEPHPTRKRNNGPVLESPAFNGSVARGLLERPVYRKFFAACLTVFD
jgi:hypothetical protein